MPSHIPFILPRGLGHCLCVVGAPCLQAREPYIADGEWMVSLAQNS